MRPTAPPQVAAGHAATLTFVAHISASSQAPTLPYSPPSCQPSLFGFSRVSTWSLQYCSTLLATRPANLLALGSSRRVWGFRALAQCPHQRYHAKHQINREEPAQQHDSRWTLGSGRLPVRREPSGPGQTPLQPLVQSLAIPCITALWRGSDARFSLKTY